MSFCTVINCIDGRTQLPVNEFVAKRFDAEYVDTITEPGPNAVLAEQANAAAVESILRCVDISIQKHGSKGLAVAGHYDCAANRADETVQARQTRRAVAFLKQRHPDVEVIGLWVDYDWRVHEIDLGED